MTKSAEKEGADIILTEGGGGTWLDNAPFDEIPPPRTSTSLPKSPGGAVTTWWSMMLLAENSSDELEAASFYDDDEPLERVPYNELLPQQHPPRIQPLTSTNSHRDRRHVRHVVDLPSEEAVQPQRNKKLVKDLVPSEQKKPATILSSKNRSEIKPRSTEKETGQNQKTSSLFNFDAWNSNTTARQVNVTPLEVAHSEHASVSVYTDQATTEPETPVANILNDLQTTESDIGINKMKSATTPCTTNPRGGVLSEKPSMEPSLEKKSTDQDTATKDDSTHVKSESRSFFSSTTTKTDLLTILQDKSCVGAYKIDAPSMLKLEEKVDENMCSLDDSMGRLMGRLEQVFSKAKQTSTLTTLDTTSFDPYDYSRDNTRDSSFDFSRDDDEIITDYSSFDPSRSPASSNHSADDIFANLQEEIGVIRQRRNDDQHNSIKKNGSSKYKELLKKGSAFHSHSQSHSDDRSETSDSTLVFDLADLEETTIQSETEEEQLQDGQDDENKPAAVTKTPQERKEELIPPPSMLKTDTQPYIMKESSIVNDASILTDGTAKNYNIRRHSSDSIPLPNELHTKSCVPTPRGLGGRIRRIKSARSGSSVSTSSNKASPGAEYPTFRMVSSSNSAEPGNMCYVYEYESSTNAYIAYFRRGDAANKSIRLYQHPSPPVFPTLVREAVVKVEASIVSKTDVWVRKGLWWGEDSDNSLNLPIVPGVAFVGKVGQYDASRNRTGLHPGDRVTSLVRVGSNSRHICVDATRLVKVPPGIDDAAAAACLPEIYLTAFQCLHIGQKNAARYRKSSLQGKSVLVIGGASPLGRAAIELSVAGGATIVYATGRTKDFSAIEEAGGFPLHRDLRKWLSLLAGKLDIVIRADTDSSTAPAVKSQHTHCLHQNGKLVIQAGPGNEESSVVDLAEIDKESVGTNRKLYRFNVFESWEADLKQGKRDLTYLLKLLENGIIQPQILERIPLQRVAKAQEIMEKKSWNGFVICEPWIKGKARVSMLSNAEESLAQDNLLRETIVDNEPEHASVRIEV